MSSEKSDKVELSHEKCKTPLTIKVVTWNINHGSIATKSNDKPKGESQPQKVSAKDEEASSESATDNDTVTDSEDEDESNTTCVPQASETGKAQQSQQSTKPKKTYKGFGRTRVIFTEAFEKKHQELFYCIQEPKRKYLKKLPYFKPIHQNTNDGAIASTNEITCPDCNKKIPVKFEEPPINQPVLTDGEVLSVGTDGKTIKWPGYDDKKRFYCRKIEIQELQYTCKFMLVSHHAVYRGITNAEKLAGVKNFFDHMCEMAKEHKMPIIIGGDFNVEVDHEKWKKNVNADMVTLADPYSAGPRRKQRNSTIIDTIAVVHPPYTDIKCDIKNIRPVEFKKIENVGEENDGVGIKVEELEKIASKNPMQTPSADNLFDMMDHDPVIAEIQLTHIGTANDK